MKRRKFIKTAGTGIGVVAGSSLLPLAVVAGKSETSKVKAAYSGCNSDTRGFKYFG